MKKIIIIAMTCALLISGCSNKKVEELNNKVSSLETSITEKDNKILELETKVNELSNELEKYTYTPGTPTVETTPLDDPDLINDLLVEMDSKIVGTISDAVVSESGSISFYVTTEKGSKYNGFITFNDDKTEVQSLTIYLNSEFCYSWLNKSMWPVGTGEWRLDGLSGE